MHSFIHKNIWLIMILALSACAAPQAVTQNIAIDEPAEAAPIETVKVEPVEPLPLTAELVYYILTAEVAGHRGEIGLATELYNKAANTVDSVAVASRSAEVANFTRDKGRINRALKRWIEVSPDNADIYILQAPFLMIQGDYDGVVQSVDKALELAPDKSRQFLAQIADRLSETVKPEQALSVVKRLASFQQQTPDALFIYAGLAHHYKQHNEALTMVNLVLKQEADRNEAIVLKAEVLQRLGKGSEAIATLKNIATQESASNELRFSYAKLLGENNKIEPARDIFEQLNLAQPESEEILFALGLLALEEKDGTQAKHYFNQLVKLGDTGKQASYFMGLAEKLNGHNDLASIWFTSVPEDSPRFQAAQSEYINMLADDGQLNKARLHLKLLRKESPKNEIHYYLFEGLFLREQHEDQAAFDLYGEALKGYPNNVELLYGRAMVAESLNRLDLLEEDLRKILEYNPNNHAVLNALGYTLTDRTSRHQEALELIEKALALKPNDPFYLDSLGWVHYRLGNLDRAVDYLKQASNLQHDVEFLAHLGEVLWQQGNHSEAKKIWQQGFNRNKENDLLNETMHRFGE